MKLKIGNNNIIIFDGIFLKINFNKYYLLVNFLGVDGLWNIFMLNIFIYENIFMLKIIEMVKIIIIWYRMWNVIFFNDFIMECNIIGMFVFSKRCIKLFVFNINVGS